MAKEITNKILLKLISDTTDVKPLLDAQGKVIKQTIKLGRKTKSEAEKMRLAMNRVNKTMKNQAKVLQQVAMIQAKQMANSTKKATQQLRNQRLVTVGLRRALGALRNQLLLVFFAYHGLRRVILPMVKSVEDQQRAESRLRFIMIKRNKESERSLFLAKQRAKELQALTGFSDNQILAMQSTLETMKKLTREQKDRLVPLTLDLARASETATGEQVSLDRVMKAVMRAMRGTTDSLTELGVGFGRFKRGALDAETVINMLEHSIGGLSLETDDFGSKVRKLRADISELSEYMGEQFIDSIENVVDAMKTVTESLNLQVENARLLKQMKELGIAISEEEANALKKEMALREQVNVMTWSQQWPLMLINILLEKGKKLWDENNETLKDNININSQLIQEKLKLNAVLAGENSRVKEITDAWTEAFEAIELGVSAMNTTKSAMSKSMSDFFFDSMQGDAENFRVYWEGFLKSIMRSFANMLAKMLLEQQTWTAIMVTLKAIANFGGTSGALSGAGKGGGLGGVGAGKGRGLGSGVGASLITAHKGGKIPSFQRGGEVLAKLEAGEGVITRRGMTGIGANGLERINRGKSLENRGITNQYFINAIDVKTFRDYLVQNEDIFVASVQGDISSNGSLRKIFRSGI